MTDRFFQREIRQKRTTCASKPSRLAESREFEFAPILAASFSSRARARAHTSVLACAAGMYGSRDIHPRIYILLHGRSRRARGHFSPASQPIDLLSHKYHPAKSSRPPTSPPPPSLIDMPRQSPRVRSPPLDLCADFARRCTAAPGGKRAS